MKKNNFIRVPYGKSVHGKDEIEAVNKVLNKSTQMGENVRKFEKKISALFNKKYGVMVNSGSSAIMLAIECLNLPKGSEVITPALTFSTTVGYLVKNDLIPVFVDVEEGTYNLNYKLVKKLITSKTKAIIAPHLIGNIIDWEYLSPILKQKKIMIIEDSADTLGAKQNSKYIGSKTDISITSFYGSHIINCAGNGGIVCFNDKKLSDKAKLLRSWGRSSSLYVESEKIENRFNICLDGISYDKKFVFEEIGHNLEPSELGAAFGLIQLKKLKQNINKRTKVFKKHINFFKRYEKYFILPKQLKNTVTGWLAFPITIKDSSPFTRKQFQIFLEKRNIQTRVVFTGNITRQPGFKNIKMKKSIKGYPEADKVMKGGVLLACHHGLTQNMINHVYNSIDLFISKFDK